MLSPFPWSPVIRERKTQIEKKSSAGLLTGLVDSDDEKPRRGKTRE